ncbi:MAG: hypothetical protein MSIBF_01860 [Candidatus Altiarchaeales archaeon IMC4]|nr:MAG: hypothetical protein MSIBF_01860 [Candidatus Altiarchaeales archaeon IMC4]
MPTKSKIPEGYNKDITIATIGSHTALQILKGAKDEGFATLVICTEKNRQVYERFNSADDMEIVKDYKDILSEKFQKKLLEKNVVLIPHGSFVEYVGAKNIEKKLAVPMFGNKGTLDWESDRKKAKVWLTDAGVKAPREFKDPKDIKDLVIVKFPGAKGGRGYFTTFCEEDFSDNLKLCKNPQEYTIQEYVVGTRFYPHYFYSPLTDKVELLSMDIRYESNADGLARTAGQTDVEPTFTVTGNTPVVVRESLLPKILEMGDAVVKSSKKLFAPGLIGPFCIETICKDDLEFVAFEISARIVAGTNLYVQGSPYSQLIYDEPMSTGRRIAREIKIAQNKRMLDRIIY